MTDVENAHHTEHGLKPGALRRRIFWIGLAVVAVMLVLVTMWRGTKVVETPEVVPLSQAGSSQQAQPVLPEADEARIAPSDDASEFAAPADEPAAEPDAEEPTEDSVER